MVVGVLRAYVQALLPGEAAVRILATKGHIAAPSDTAKADVDRQPGVERKVEEGARDAEKRGLHLRLYGGACKAGPEAAGSLLTRREFSRTRTREV